MRIDFVRLYQFRNYSRAKILFHPNVNIIYGNNGEGKTNLLEAIQVLLSGESFRPGETEDLICKDAEERKSSLISQVVINKNECKLEIQLRENHKDYFLNDKKISRQKLQGSFSSVVFSPESLEAIKSGPSSRRDLFDEICMGLFPESFDIFSDYKKCLKARNKILKDAFEFKKIDKETKLTFESINTVFLRLATEVTCKRIECIRTVLPQLKNTMFSLFKPPFDDRNVDIFVDYVISDQCAIDWDKNRVYDVLEKRIHELQSAEFNVGQSLVGPHRHDVRFYFAGKDARFYCSQGQQRSIILALKIAQICMHVEHRGFPPVLLLDDVFSELDVERRTRLLAILEEMAGQIFLTTTDFESTSYLPGKDKFIYEIEKGNLKHRDGNSV